MSIGAENATTAFNSENAAQMVDGMSTSSQEFQNQVEATDSAVLAMARKAFGDNDDGYNNFERRYKEVMVPKAQEMVAQLASHAAKAKQLEEAGSEMAAYNNNVINNS